MLDRDADGFPIPADCNDANALIRPGALEVKGNAVDENCDSRAEPFALLRALVLNNWSVDGRRTKLRLLDRAQRAAGRADRLPLHRHQLPVAPLAVDAPCRAIWRRSGSTTAPCGARRCDRGRS